MLGGITTQVRDWGEFRTGGVYCCGASQISDMNTNKRKRMSTANIVSSGRAVLVPPNPVTLEEEFLVKQTGKKRVQTSALIIAAAKQIAYTRSGEMIKDSELPGWIHTLLLDHAGVGFEKSTSYKQTTRQKKGSKKSAIDYRLVIPRIFLMINNGDGFVSCNYNKTAYKRKYLKISVDTTKLKLFISKADKYTNLDAFTYGNMVNDGLVHTSARGNKTFDIPFADPKYLLSFLDEFQGSCSTVAATKGKIPITKDELEKRRKFSSFYSTFTCFEPLSGENYYTTEKGQQVVRPESCNAVLGANMRKIATDSRYYEHFGGKELKILPTDVSPDRGIVFGQNLFIHSPKLKEDEKKETQCKRAKLSVGTVSDISVPSASEVSMLISADNWIPQTCKSVYSVWCETVSDD